MTATAHAAPVQTSAQHPEPDLFADEAPLRPEAEAVLELACIVITDAQVRTAAIGADQHPVPVLSVRVQSCHGLGQVVDVDLIFTEATRELAHSKAAGLKRGTKVTVRSTTTDMRIHLPHAQSITTLN